MGLWSEVRWVGEPDSQFPDRMRSCKSQTGCLFFLFFLPFSLSFSQFISSQQNNYVFPEVECHRPPPPPPTEMVYSSLKVHSAKSRCDNFSFSFQPRMLPGCAFMGAREKPRSNSLA